MPNGDKEKKASDIASQATRDELGKTKAGLPIRPKSPKEQRQQRKKNRRASKGKDNGSGVVNEQLSTTASEKSSGLTGAPNVSDGIETVPLAYKNSFTPEIQGGGVDENGMDLTPHGELMKAIKKEDDPTDTRTIEEIGTELDLAKDFEIVLSDEQEKAKKIQLIADPDIEEPPVTGMSKVDTDIRVPPLTTKDIETETNTLIQEAELGNLDAVNKFNNMLEQVNKRPINYGEPALERLGLQDYYPDINTPLQVGTYSGSIVGNNPIFVAGGGYIPVGIIDARRRALERAAANRVKKGEKLKELMLVDSAEQYQDKINEYGLNIFNKYGESVGWDYNQLMDMSNPTAREFQKEYQNYRANAKRTIAIQKQYEKVLKDLTEGERYVPPHIIGAMEDWQSGMWNIESLEDPKMLEKIEREMQSYDNMTKDAEDMSKDIQKDQTFFGDVNIPVTEEELAEYNKELELIRSSGRYDILRTGTFKYVPVDRIARLVDTKVNYKNYYNPEQTKEDMFQYLNDLISTEIMPKYIEANKGNVTNIHIDNAPKNVTQSNESRILGNMGTWKNSLASAIPAGDAAVKTEMQNNLGLEPVVGSDGKFINGEIRGKYSLTEDQNNGVQNYSMGDMTFIPAGSSDRLSLREYQERIVESRGLGTNYDSLLEFKRNKKLSDNEFMDALINGDYGMNFAPEDAWILSRHEGSTTKTKWTKKEYVQKWQDVDGNWHVLNVNDSPDVVSSSVPFNQVFGSVIDEGIGEGATFGGFSFYIDYNLNNYLGDLPAIDTYNTGASGVMKKESDQNNMTATQRKGGTADNNTQGGQVGSEEPIVVD